MNASVGGSLFYAVAAFLFPTLFLIIFAEIITVKADWFTPLKLRSPLLRICQFVLYPVARPTAKV